MKTFITALLGALFAVVSTLPAQAESFNLLTHHAWKVDFNVNDTDGSQYCDAYSRNANGDRLAIVSYQDKSVMMFLFLTDDHWGRDFEADLALDIDYRPWTLYDADFWDGGQFSQDNVTFNFPDLPVFGEFLEDLAAGSALALKSPSRTRSLATWSLRGSTEAIIKLAECSERLDPLPSTDTYGVTDTY